MDAWPAPLIDERTDLVDAIHNELVGLRAPPADAPVALLDDVAATADARVVGAMSARALMAEIAAAEARIQSHDAARARLTARNEALRRRLLGAADESDSSDFDDGGERGEDEHAELGAGAAAEDDAMWRARLSAREDGEDGDAELGAGAAAKDDALRRARLSAREDDEDGDALDDELGAGAAAEAHAPWRSRLSMLEGAAHAARPAIARVSWAAALEAVLDLWRDEGLDFALRDRDDDAGALPLGRLLSSASALSAWLRGGDGDGGGGALDRLALTCAGVCTAAHVLGAELGERLLVRRDGGVFVHPRGPALYAGVGESARGDEPLRGAALAPLAAPAMLGALGEPRCAEMRRFALAGYVVARRKARELCARVEDGAIAVRLDIDAGEQVAAARFAALLEGRWDQDGPEE